jgi:hypothetical protein
MGHTTRPSRLLALVIAGSATMGVVAQTPQPFPQPGPPPARPAETQAPPTRPAAAAASPQAPGGVEAAPTEAVLGFPVYPTAVFLRSHDAGRGQRYYLFGVGSPFAEMVTYYRNVLRDRGTLVFEVPPTHVFEIGRFREETMAFPPGVTIKDYTFNGTAGYPNPRPGSGLDRYPTLIQIVPPPPAGPEN